MAAGGDKDDLDRQLAKEADRIQHYIYLNARFGASYGHGVEDALGDRDSPIADPRIRAKMKPGEARYVSAVVGLNNFLGTEPSRRVDEVNKLISAGGNPGLRRAQEERSRFGKLLNCLFDMDRITLSDEKVVLAAGDREFERKMAEEGISDLKGFRGPFVVEAATQAMKEKLIELHPDLRDVVRSLTSITLTKFMQRAYWGSSQPDPGF